MSSRIYAAEDDDNIREILRCTLESYGYEVEVFESVAPMLERMRQQLPDLVLMDIMMPEIDGFEFARTVRKVINGYRFCSCLRRRSPVQAKRISAGN